MLSLVLTRPQYSVVKAKRPLSMFIAPLMPSIDIFHNISTAVSQNDLPPIQLVIEIGCLYDRTSATKSVNVTRLELLPQKS